ncbi:class I SAM-dependent methyltransferase [Lentzea sp. BCCO 10_0856]|uniref:Class I SAM-dependent methyltransferase n=1 Tax=Lentzea miocenica TaxID=3095431 RepID=A0ABU4T7J7_9PSEU|nr:class I SAM-dependent methyltransferase [Lentzea sp. BCCO 10_0856]MDX8034139.1 class I SAM-dependent methyltransferase [Lentzea sp. BCCO 10_0856]
MTSGARTDVLAFYRELPFNHRRDARTQAGLISGADPARGYPPLVTALRPGLRLLDVGCGTGWLPIAAALHHRCLANGVDFNPVAVDRAREVADLLGVPVSFEVADLFTYRPGPRFDLVTSLGVLHHTDDCVGGLVHIGQSMVAGGGRMIIGLYHEHAREPFLAHFDRMRRRGASEDALYAEFRRLRHGGAAPADDDDTFLRSWFRDQVLHPHETRHTLAEMLPVLADIGFTLESTSVNGFGPLPDDPGELRYRERALAHDARRALAAGRYDPGFFLFQAVRTKGAVR